MTTKKIVYIDMDDTLCDFIGPFKSGEFKLKYPQSKVGFFLDLKPLELAIEGVKLLKEKYDVVYFDKDLVTETYNSLYNDGVLNGRELYALVDFLIGKNLKVDTFIGAEGEKFTSSFSVLLKNIKDYNNIVVV